MPTPTTTVVVGNPNPVAAGKSIAFTVTVSAGSGTPTGTVIISIDGIAVTGALSLVNGQVVYVSPGLAIGYHLVTVAYTPTGVFSASNGQAYQAVTRPIEAFAL